MADTVTIDAPLSADGALVYKGNRAGPYVHRSEIPAGAADAAPAISAAKVAVVLARGEEATVVFTASGVFVASRRVVAGRPRLALDSISPTTFARNAGVVNLTLTGGIFLPVGSCEVFIDGIRFPVKSATSTQLVVVLDAAFFGVGVKAVKVRRAGLDSASQSLTVT